MSKSYVCLQFRQRLLQKSWHARGLSFVSLSQTIRQSDENFSADRKTQPVHSQDDRRSHRTIERRGLQHQKPATRVQRSPPGIDPALEALFSSQQEKQREPIGTRYPGTPIGRAKLRYKQLSELDQVILGLQRQEEQIRDSIQGIALSFRDAENLAPLGEDTFIIPSPETQPKKVLMISLFERLLHLSGI